MNKKQLYESIMASVAKEVKKALLENSAEKYNLIELEAIHYNQLPSKFKNIIDGENIINGEKMSHQQLIKFIADIDWNLLGKEYQRLYPNASSFYEEYILDYNISMNGCTLYVQVPCSNISLTVDAKFDWKYIPYYPGNRWQPAEGGYSELNDYTITNINIEINDTNYMSLSQDEIVKYKLNTLFNNEIYTIADGIDQDTSYFA